ncbi:MAG: flavodoxin domain-containing protein [Candidatus Omnitrophica bacterium]|nr:flavodoxin domain-containing protein [Candidatus Omnitrophota bacterium]
MRKIKNDVYWVGYIDWDLRNFHGYDTPHGSTYNAYLILDEKPTLIDSVKHYGADEMIRRIKQVIDPSKIQYIISNHTEMDHSGSIDVLLKHCPNAQVVCSPKGEEGLSRHFKKNWNFKVVNTGDTLDIGKRKLTFMLMPMVHWPDSMATYSAEDKILFPNDAFGQHYASTERFADEIGVGLAYDEAAKYYANIVLPFGSQVLKALEGASKMDFDMICPSHGMIWRGKEQITGLVQRYVKWANYESDAQVCITYDSMWHSTEAMAKRFYEVIDMAGIPVKLMNLQTSHMSDVVTDVLKSKVVLFGTSMLNNRMLPTVGALMMYLKGLKPKNRFALSFGSYGWSMVGFKELETSIQDAGFELLGEGKYIRFIPDQDELAKLDSILPLIQAKLAAK